MINIDLKCSKTSMYNNDYKHLFICTMNAALVVIVFSMVLIPISLTMGYSLDFLSDRNCAVSLSTGKSRNVDQLVFIDPTCRLPDIDDDDDDNEKNKEGLKLLMIFKCDLKPLLEVLKKMLYDREEFKIDSLADIDKLDLGGISTTAGKKAAQPQLIWEEFQNIDQSIEGFYSDSMSGLGRAHYCTYPTIDRFSRAKKRMSESKFLSYVYDIITIEYHRSCLVDAISKLPMVPSMVREVVNIYVKGADQAIPDLNGEPQVFDDETGDTAEFKFDVQEALARHGRLKNVVKLSLSTLHMNPDLVGSFKDKCRNFLVEIEERWQSMEMMNKMISTEGNGIQSFNNYIMRRLIPTKYADICSQLTAADDEYALNFED